jgi:hypothetical protein
MTVIAEGSLNQETLARAGAALTKPGHPSTTGWGGFGKQSGKVYARNRCVKPLKKRASSNPVDSGWIAMQTHPSSRTGNSLVISLGWLGRPR